MSQSRAAFGFLLMASVNLPAKAVRTQISSAIDMIVQVSRMRDGMRRITHIMEVVGMEGDMVSMQDIFLFEKTGLRQDGKVCGRFRATGIRPKCSERLAASGFPLPADMFEHVKVIG